MMIRENTTAKELFFSILKKISNKQYIAQQAGADITTLKDQQLTTREIEDMLGVMQIDDIKKTKELLLELVKLGLLSKKIITIKEELTGYYTFKGQYKVFVKYDAPKPNEYKTAEYSFTQKAIAYVTQLKNQKVAN